MTRAAAILVLAAGCASTNPFVDLFNGRDLAGWKDGATQGAHWTVRDGIIDFDGKAKDLWTEREYGDFELTVEWRLPGPALVHKVPVVKPDGSQEGAVIVEDFGDSGVYLRGSSKSQVNIWCWPVGSGEVYGYRTDPKMPADVRAGVTPKACADRKGGEWNRFDITMKGDRLTVVLNGVTVISDAQLPGVAARGPVALQSHGDPVQFRNVRLRELR